MAADHRGYGAKFAALVESGEDIDGEARLADTLVSRNATVLDVGAGMGRVGAALQRRGHRVLAVEKDRALVGQARATYPDLPVLESDLLGLHPAALIAAGWPAAVDLVVAVGNVMVLLAHDSERRALRTLRQVTRPGGRLLVGFHPTAGPFGARDYPPEEFVADAVAAGWSLDLRAGGYDLVPPNEQYAVFVLSAPSAADPT